MNPLQQPAARFAIDKDLRWCALISACYRDERPIVCGCKAEARQHPSDRRARVREAWVNLPKVR